MRWISPRAFKSIKRCKSRFISDVTLPDGTVVAPGTKVCKIWKLGNCGQQDWPSGTMLLHVGGDSLLERPQEPIVVDPAPANGEVDIAVDLIADHGVLLASCGGNCGTELVGAVVVHAQHELILVESRGNCDVGLARAVDLSANHNVTLTQSRGRCDACRGVARPTDV